MLAPAWLSGTVLETSSGELVSGKTKSALPATQHLSATPNRRPMPKRQCLTRYARTSNLRETGRRRNYAHARLAGSAPQGECAAVGSQPAIAAGPLLPCDCRSADQPFVAESEHGADSLLPDSSGSATMLPGTSMASRIFERAPLHGRGRRTRSLPFIALPAPFSMRRSASAEMPAIK